MSLVRVITGTHRTRFEAEGVVHRYPITRPVTAGMASRLAADGVPVVVRGVPGDPEGVRC